MIDNMISPGPHCTREMKYEPHFPIVYASLSYSTFGIGTFDPE